MMLRIVMDSAGDIPSEWEDEYDVHIIPINIHFGEQTFYQGVDLTNDGFYKLVKESGTIPKTSQPTPHQFENFYRKIANPGDTIISIHVTSKLSGTFESAEITAKEMIEEMKIIPVDSGGGSASIGYMCRETREMERKGFKLSKIIERLNYIREHTEIILTLDTLEYARLSGRMKAMQAALASVLNVKPIVTLADGLLDVTEKVRTRGRSIERIIEKMRNRMGDKLVNIAVVHASDPSVGNKLLELVKNSFNYKDLILSELSTGIAANLGPGTVGIIAYPVMEG
jgi:DegV family protein with EDD domain